MTSTNTVRLSNSEIETFLGCRRKWWLTYYRRLRSITPERSGALVLGSRVHKALEAYYAHDIPLMDAHEALVATARTEADADPYADMKKINSEFELSRLMLEGYLQWVEEEGVDSDLEITGVEEILEVPMLGGDVTLMGKVDLRVIKKRYDLTAILDWKTTASFAEFDALADMRSQLKTYSILDMVAHPDAHIDGGVYRLLRKVKRSATAKPPFYRDVIIRHSTTTLRSYWNVLQGVLTDLMRTRTMLDSGFDPTIAAYPRVSRDCTWACPFKAVCPLFDDGSDVEQAIADLYVQVDPYDYYDREGDGGTDD